MTFKVKHNVIANAINAANSQSTAWFAPLARKEMKGTEWLGWVMAQNAERADGSQYPAIYAVNGSAPYAVSQVTKALWAAQHMGYVPYVQAIHHAKAFRALAEDVTHAIAAQLGQGVPEITAAKVRVRTQHQVSDAPRDFKTEVQETFEEARKAWASGDISEDDYKLIVNHLREEVAAHKAAREMGQLELKSSDGAMAQDEGSIETAVHEPSDLWAYQPKDVLGSETLMVMAAHHFGDVELPLDDPSWGSFLSRFEESQALRVEYADDPETEMAKAEYRVKVATEGLTSIPWKARWAVNAMTRRLWRDMKDLQRRINRMEEQKDRVGEQMAREERFNLPAKMTRIMSQHPIETQDEPRMAYLVWEVIEEAQFAPRDLIYTTHDGNVEQYSEGLFRIQTLAAIQGHAEGILHQMQRIYDRLRAVEDALAPIWTEFAGDAMPSKAPIYWNREGFYLTEEEAVTALQAEWAAQEVERKARIIDGAGAVLEEMLAAQGWA